jgi:cyanophycin synthetase
MTHVNDRATAVTSGGRPSADLAIIETRVYRGANVWSYDKAIHLVVDLGVLEEYPTNTLPGFTEHLLDALPGLREHSCSRGRRGGFVERLNEGTWLGHVAEHVALALQQVVGHDIRRGKTRAVKGEKGRYNIIYGYVDEQVGLEAGRLAVRLVNHLVRADPDFDFEEDVPLEEDDAEDVPFLEEEEDDDFPEDEIEGLPDDDREER